jgi:1,2-diacylglycerol 3-beta-galactosyltransferase
VEAAEPLGQARLIGYRPERIFQVSGMILKPDFYRDDGKDRRSERERLGLDPDLPTALVMFGGNGSKASIKIVTRLVLGSPAAKHRHVRR